MIERLADQMAEYLIRNQIVKEDERGFYALGFDVLISTLLTAAAILMLGVLLHDLSGAFFYLLSFIHIRNYSGGYHAKTRSRCFFVSAGSYLASYIIVKFFFRWKSHIPGWSILLAVAGCVGIFIWRAPVENKNKRLPPDWKMRNRAMTFIALLLWLSVAAVLWKIWMRASVQILAVIFVIALLLIAAEKN